MLSTWRSELDLAVLPLWNINSTWAILHVVAINKILFSTCSTFQSPKENKHASGKNKINVITRENVVVISILIECQMEKQNKQWPAGLY